MIARLFKTESQFVEKDRLVMEKEIGRKLSAYEKVHHINGLKSDNHISNLYLCHSEREYANIQGSLEDVTLELLKEGIILFDRTSAAYKRNKHLFPESLDFSQISFKQKKNKSLSRLDIDLSSEIIKGVRRPIPLIAANMSTVVNSSFYIQLYNSGAFAILHRALLEADYLQEVARVAAECEWVASSIGVGKDQYVLATKLIESGSNIIVIDIAHGYADSVIELGRALKQKFKHIKMVVGNTTNPDMLDEVSDFADAVKVGIAQGFACETKNTAGCTEKQFSAVLKFKERAKALGMPIISDGGIRESADFVKAIAAGANSVMAGSIFAACPESAGSVVNGKKLYAGMASEYVQSTWKGGLKAGTCAEGGVRMLEINNGFEALLNHYSGSLRSGITYAGELNIEDFQKNVEFIKL